MKKKNLTLLTLLVVAKFYGQSAFGDAIGTVLDEDSKQPMEYIKAFILDQGKKVSSHHR